MGPLIKLISLNVITYLILKFVVPNIPGSAPLPASLVFLYLLLTTSGFLILATVSAESKEEFWGPLQRFLTGEGIGGLQVLRYLVLILFPLLVGWQTYNSTAVSNVPPGENRTIHPAPPGEYAGFRIQFQRHLKRSSRGRDSMRHSVPPATEETSTARALQRGDSILPRLTLPIPRRSRCSWKVISSGGLRRAASAFRSKGCRGNPRCLAGSLNFQTNGSGKSSWVSMMARINRQEPGSRGTEEGMESIDLLCSRNARLPKALVGRAQWEIKQPPSL